MMNEFGTKLDANGYAPSIVDYYGTTIKRCYKCHWRGDLARHEIFNGANRQKSKAYGLWVLLCPRCHADLHDHPSNWKWLKVDGERQALAHYGWSVEEWIERFGKNYI